MGLREKLKLYTITDRRLKPEIESVKQALEGGATAIQLRIKDASTREMYEIGKEIRKLTNEYDALFFVDDRIDVALAVNADGVQLGPEDMPIEIAREIAPNLIIGASVYSLEEALKAERMGADYLGAGSVFPTKTKRDVKVIGLDGLKEIVRAVRIPVVAIGGINAGNARDVLLTGVSGIAVISAVMGAEDVRRATQELRKIVEEVLG
ncbi:thiamine-phosphate pyrophosphorylase [Pyrococcus sp. NA2]|uniref:thiamine phosphate synthase n=1 Tax=Pyrococcus sp. (strain NA2) TaxID=342949 RepID=UPI000209AB8D|nr:thiamine phosphate synthase [Pyrococcus sp. NA2]AEC52680.1 thiamine-phosphate pyrophosphorylase [Pyrococcus sp. NA2]